MSETPTRSLRSVCVFCGSRPGIGDTYANAARRLGQLLAKRNLKLVFGGGSVGLMGIVADAVLDASGDVTGILPHRLATKELTHIRVADMRLVPDMHARKALMAELSDAFIALPGGYGTFEELFEVITWGQLGIHRKPIGLLNTAGYYDPLVRLVDHAIETEFIRPEHRGLIVVEERPEALLDRLGQHVLPSVEKWLGQNQT